MRCTTCGYALWNTTPGACSECGTRWRFEDFRFNPGVVQFCCDHCGHAYRGEDALGLPQPRAFTCVGCGEAIGLDSMRALPAPGIADDAAMVHDHAWTNRARVGRWRAFWVTVGQSMVNPSKLARSLPPDPELRPALRFAELAIALPVVGSMLPMAAMPFMLSAQWTNPQSVQRMWPMWLGLLLVWIGFVLGTLCFVALCAMASHALLLLAGCARRSLRSTVCAALYCTGPWVIACVPCCGVYLGAVSALWSMIAFVNAVRVLHGTNVVRALGTAAGPPMVVVATAAVVLVVAIIP